MTLSYPSLALHVAGQWIDRTSGGSRPVLNPETAMEIGLLPLAGPTELSAAAESAQRGFRVWRTVRPLDRYVILRRAADLLRQRVEAIASVLTLEQGKPLSEARREVSLSADIIDFQAEEAKRLYGRAVAPGWRASCRTPSRGWPPDRWRPSPPGTFPSTCPAASWAARSLQAAVSGSCALSRTS